MHLKFAMLLILIVPPSGPIIGVNLRSPHQSNFTNTTLGFQCHPHGESEATIILSFATLGVVTNIIMMSLILINKHLRRWSQGLLFHQGVVDCGRAAILLPLGFSILHCEPIYRCSLIETGFLLLVTVSTINMLTTVLNDSPVFPEDENEEDLASGPLLMDSPQCVFFGTFMIWFASITINLGPTFLSGGLAARSEIIRNAPSCPLMHGPFRHYILNALWIIINMICVGLTFFHLHKLHRDLTKANVEAVKVAGLLTTLVSVTGASGPSRVSDGNSRTSRRAKKSTGSMCSALEEQRRMRNYLLRIEREGIQKVKMFLVIATAYMVFWGPLFFVTLVRPKMMITDTEGYEMTLQIAYVHAIINPLLFLILHRGLRHAAVRLCCGCFIDCIRKMWRSQQRDNQNGEETDFVVEVPQADLLVPPPPPPTLHQPSAIAQFSQSISQSSTYSKYRMQDKNSSRVNFASIADEKSWKTLTKPITLKDTRALNDHHVATTSQAYHLNSTTTNTPFSGYSSCSD